jgi:hypothetical protein
VLALNSSTQEAEAGGTQVPGQDSETLTQIKEERKEGRERRREGEMERGRGKMEREGKGERKNCHLFSSWFWRLGHLRAWLRHQLGIWWGLSCLQNMRHLMVSQSQHAKETYNKVTPR